jgi:hypothetical protein
VLARVTDTDLVARGSFFQRDFIRKQCEQELPLHLIAHEDVVVLRKPSTSAAAKQAAVPAVADLALSLMLQAA